MKRTPRLGLQAEQVIVVGPENRISFADARMPAVLATPWLIAHLESAARTRWSLASRITSAASGRLWKWSTWPRRPKA